MQNPKNIFSIVAQKANQLDATERRDFLKKGLTLIGGSTVVASANSSQPFADDPWSKQLGPGVVSKAYGQPSPHEQHVVRRNVPWLTADTISSISFTPIHELKGIITPNGLVFERYHAGIPSIPYQKHRLAIHGDVKRPLVFSMDDLTRFPSISVIRFLECPANGGMEWRGAQMEAVQFTHGMISCCEWTGVPLSLLLQEAGIKPSGKWLLAEGADGAGMTRSIPIEKALDDSLVVYAQNGEKLRPEQGYPLRLFNPGWEGNTSIKWLRRIKVGDKPWHHREETSKYTDLMEDGKARRFTWVMEANSVILNPCPEKPWTSARQSHYEIEGIAWSGRGTIKHVDISDNGGVTWQPAHIKGAVLPKCLTRFSMPYQWDGTPRILQSRAVDDTGYVQPTLAALRESRGVESIYHKNAIQSWRLSADGQVSNVQIR